MRERFQFSVCPPFPPVAAPLHDSHIAAKFRKLLQQTYEIRSRHDVFTLMVRQSSFIRRESKFERADALLLFNATALPH